MADSISVVPNKHVARLAGIPADNTVDELVERLTGQGLIDMKSAARMYGPNTHKSTPIRHHVKGVLVNGNLVHLEAIRVGGALRTSREAVLKFFAAQNAPAEPTSPAPIETPAKRTSVAAAAHSKVAALLKTKS